MANLSRIEWEIARKTWSEDSRTGYGWLAQGLNVSRQAVSKMASKQEWRKVAQSKRAQPKLPPVAPQELKANPSSPDSAIPLEDGELITRRPNGRPTAYRAKFVDEMISFFSVPVESVANVCVVGKDGTTTTETRNAINVFPTLTRFASTIGVTRETLHDWATAKRADGNLNRPEFSYAYARARDLQDALLIEGGLSGRYESRFAVFTAKNLLGWKDQIETTTEIAVSGTSVEELNRSYRDGMEAVARNQAAALIRMMPVDVCAVKKV